MATAEPAAKARPILFSGPMVRAILEGRKTQTRRVLKPQPEYAQAVEREGRGVSAYHWPPSNPKFRPMSECTGHSPYGQPGGRLWVRESMAWISPDDEPRLASECVIEYRADLEPGCTDRPGGWPRCEGGWQGENIPRWTPSIHMPRSACRLALEVLSVRLERVQAISEADAIAEGLASWTKDGALRKWGLAKQGQAGELDALEPWQDLSESPGAAFSRLWDSINEARGYPWAANPWVWVVEFRRLEQAEGVA